MPAGVLFSLAAYLLYSCCDAIIKGFGTDLSVFEIAFWSALFSFGPAMLTKPKGEHWRSFWRMQHPWLVNLRGIAGVVGNISIIYAFVSIPLAEAYALAFLAPVFIVGLSRFILKEEVTLARWIFLGASFLGVLLVVRPGFKAIEPGHLTAIFAALMGAVTTTTLRMVAPVEKRVTLIGVPLGYIVVVNGVLMLFNGFTLPSWEEFALLVTIGALGGTGNILFIAATRRAKASVIAPTQYSQIAWAVVFGVLLFGEFPDLITYCGLAVVALGGSLNVMSDETRIRIFSRLSLFGPASVMGEASKPLGQDAVLAEAKAADAADVTSPLK